MKLRHVEFAGAAGQMLPRADELQPVVVANALSGTSDDLRNFARDGAYFLEKLRELAVLVSLRAAFCFDGAFLAQKLLHQIISEVASRRDVGQVKNRADRRLVRYGTVLTAVPVKTLRKRFEPQIEAVLFAAGKFVEKQAGVVHLAGRKARRYDCVRRLGRSVVNTS